MVTSPSVEVRAMFSKVVVLAGGSLRAARRRRGDRGRRSAHARDLLKLEGACAGTHHLWAGALATSGTPDVPLSTARRRLAETAIGTYPSMESMSRMSQFDGSSADIPATYQSPSARSFLRRTHGMPRERRPVSVSSNPDRRSSSLLES